jgi:peptide/nickel transport system substrate-binding protein
LVPSGAILEITRRALLLLWVILVPAGPAGGGMSDAAKDGGAFRIAMSSEHVGSIDAAFNNLPGSSLLLRAACGGLLTTPDKPLPGTLKAVPELAAGFPKISNGGKTYTFTIRKGVRFSTGAPVTARDFAHTLNRFLDPNLKSPQAVVFRLIVGAKDVIAGRAQTASGIVASGRKLIIKLTKRAGDFISVVGDVCVVPADLPSNPEGAKAPLPSAGPYYFAEYVPERQIVLRRNRYYHGPRHHHVDRFVVDLDVDDSAALDRVESNQADWAFTFPPSIAARAPRLAKQYGINKSRFFVGPGDFLDLLILNNERPLFRNNPALRRAVNFAVNRAALVRELGPHAASPTDQYLLPLKRGFVDAHIYPLKRPNLTRARALARGHTRSGKAVFYTRNDALGIAHGQIVRDNLKRIGLEVEVKPLPRLLLFSKLATRGEPFDIGWIAFGFSGSDPSMLNLLFDGRTIGQPGFGNYSYFNSPKYNGLLEHASRLSGPARYRAYGRLDVDLARNAAPAVAYGYVNVLTLVSKRVGCIVVNPYLDLAAACLK